MLQRKSSKCSLCVCSCGCVRMSACVRACVRARACVRVSVWVPGRVGVCMCVRAFSLSFLACKTLVPFFISICGLFG
jgi:hypothetical protein